MSLKVAPTPLEPWRDSYGLICFKGENGDLDGGDTCANEFTVAYCAHKTHIKYDGDRALNLLWQSNVPVRHPDASKWYSDQDRLSRDQLTPLLIYLASTRHDRLKDWFALRRTVNFLWAFNSVKNFVYKDQTEHALKSTPDVPWNPTPKKPDFTGPDIWAIELRALIGLFEGRLGVLLAPVLVWPLLVLLDVHGLLNAALGRIWPSRTFDRRNLTLKTHFCATHYPTPISWLASKFWGGPQANYAAQKWWTKPGEPPLHTWVKLLDWP